jgi:hypothetical protein
MVHVHRWFGREQNKHLVRPTIFENVRPVDGRRMDEESVELRVGHQSRVVGDEAIADPTAVVHKGLTANAESVAVRIGPQ